MQRIVVGTVEEQLVAKSVREECPWESLPKRLQAAISTKEEWHRRIIEYCVKKRAPWNSCFARKVCREGEYYDEMMRYLRKNLALYPYHLAEYVSRVMRLSPFRYYCDMIFEVMKNEQPYDSIPNFSAADALRLTGVGRNEFIDIMNKCRSKKLMWKLNKSIAKEMLPMQPVDFPIEPWWGVCLVNFTIDEFKKLSEEETAMIDKICKEEANSYILFDPEILNGLYKRGLIYYDVPVYPEDRFKVSRLEGFVSNRDQSYEDPIEELLYAVFVVSSENATVAELAATLQADLSQLQAAASFACRLGWAVKLVDMDSALQDSVAPGLPSNILSDEEDGSSMSINSEKSFQQVLSLDNNEPKPMSGTAHVGFVVDANVTSYLMMGSLSPGLKSNAVTLYEAGKLGDSSIAELCKDLASLEGKKFEGVLQEFANHAFSLRCILECLKSGGIGPSESESLHGAGDSINVGSLLDEITSLASEMSVSKKVDPSDESEDSEVEQKTSKENGHAVVPEESSTHLSEELSMTYALTERKAALFEESANGPTQQGSKSAATVDVEALKSSQNFVQDGSNVDRTMKRKRKYRLDLLRCESLASLAPATLERLFLRDYDIIVSMVPLPSLTVLPGPSGPLHFGPPSYASMTPWMKLLLYTAAGCGPLSVIFMKGQRLRLLPEPLAGCKKALMWSWDSSVVGGLGGKFEGNLVNGNVLLHCLNSLLRHSAVLVQPLSKDDLDASGKFVSMDVALPLKNFDGSIPPIGLDNNLPMAEASALTSLLDDLSNKIHLCTVGYLRLIRLHKVRNSDTSIPNGEKYEWVPLSLELGVPLFSPELCNNICKRVVASRILQADELREHHDAMQSLRRRLKEVCNEYQATGSIAKLYYQKGNTAKEPQKQLITYASGRWSPFLDPSTPTSAASSDHDRLKLGRRVRGRTEILSFDGNILRSYALTPVYEASMRPIDESAPLSTSKSEPDDADSKDTVLPGVNLLFDGAELHPFDIGACLQARQPIALIAEASAASVVMHSGRAS